MKTFFENFAFNDLLNLFLDIESVSKRQALDECLSLIAHKCPKLTKFELHLKDKSISKGFLTIFCKFNGLKKLIIQIYLDESRAKSSFHHSFEGLPQCSHLKELTVNYPHLKEQVFSNISTSLPELRILCIQSEKDFSDSFIKSFLSMKSIAEVNHEYLLKSPTEDHKTRGSKMWYFGKSLSEVMLSPDGVNVKAITQNCGLIEESHY